jgi:hypothetical protein
MALLVYRTIQSVQIGKVNILGGHSVGYCIQKISRVHLSHSERLLHCALYRRSTLYVLARLAKCSDINGGIFENVLYIYIYICTRIYIYTWCSLPSRYIMHYIYTG